MDEIEINQRILELKEAQIELLKLQEYIQKRFNEIGLEIRELDNQKRELR